MKHTREFEDFRIGLGISGIPSPLASFRLLSISRPIEREKGIFSLFPGAKIRFREYRGQIHEFEQFHELKRCKDYLQYLAPLVLEDCRRLPVVEQNSFLRDCLEEVTAISSWPPEARKIYPVYSDILQRVKKQIEKAAMKGLRLVCGGVAEAGRAYDAVRSKRQRYPVRRCDQRD